MKIFRVGEAQGHTERHRSNLITHSANPACMKILHKDHKGPGKVKVRRLNGPGMNAGISNCLADLLEPIAGEMKTKFERGSTESFLSTIDTYNEGVDRDLVRKMCREIVDEVAGGQVGGQVEQDTEVQGGEGTEVIVGLDAVGLYPSISKEVAMKICREVALESEVNIEHINLLEATRFLVLTWSKEKVEKCDIKEYLPVRRRSPGKKVGKLGLTTENSISAIPNDQSQ